MKGVNQMILNHQTLIEAVQHWLNDGTLQMSESVVVHSLKPTQKKSGEWVFTIEIENRQQIKARAEKEAKSVSEPSSK